MKMHNWLLAAAVLLIGLSPGCTKAPNVVSTPEPAHHGHRDHKAQDHSAQYHKAQDHKAQDHKAQDHKAQDHKAQDHKAQDHNAQDHNAQNHNARDHNAQHQKTKPTGHRKHARDHEGHHHRHHRFDDPQRWAKVFESDSRDAWQRPAEVIAKLALPAAAQMAEIGSSTGYWTVRLARARPKGKVYGVDIEPAMVRYLADRAKREGLANVETVLGKPDNPQIPAPVDLVLICNTYHHIGQRIAYLRRLRASLRPGGRVAIVDFRMGKLPFGPPERMRVPPGKLVEEFSAAGYKVVMRDEKLLPYQYVVVFAVG